MNGFCRCPRCGDQVFEKLETYAHCTGCLYFEDYHHDSQRSYFDALAAEKILNDEEENSEVVNGEDNQKLGDDDEEECAEKENYESAS